VNQLTTKGIVLARTPYGEADRIVTMLTPDHGKLRLMVRGVRKLKSKMAGGIELFSVSEITYIKGRGDIGTMISARLNNYYSNIVKDIDRVQLGYELIKQLNKATEDEPESDYFDLLEQAFAALDDAKIGLTLIGVWFQAQLLQLSGHTPNLQTDVSGQKLSADQRYDFDYDAMAFTSRPKAAFAANHVKFLRLIFSSNHPQTLSKVDGVEKLAHDIQLLVRTAFQAHIRI
jgi:DNA repair protein RecO (recombination protein O)